MYFRENIDPRFLGLHVHLRSVRLLKTLQWYQSLGLFSIRLDAICVQSLKNEVFVHCTYELAESMGGLDESMTKCKLLVESVHALHE